jgi:hypothetical protein
MDFYSVMESQVRVASFEGRGPCDAFQSVHKGAERVAQARQEGEHLVSGEKWLHQHEPHEVHSEIAGDADLIDRQTNPSSMHLSALRVGLVNTAASVRRLGSDGGTFGLDQPRDVAQSPQPVGANPDSSGSSYPQAKRDSSPMDASSTSTNWSPENLAHAQSGARKSDREVNQLPAHALQLFRGQTSPEPIGARGSATSRTTFAMATECQRAERKRSWLKVRTGTRSCSNPAPLGVLHRRRAAPQLFRTNVTGMNAGCVMALPRKTAPARAA